MVFLFWAFFLSLLAIFIFLWNFDNFKYTKSLESLCEVVFAINLLQGFFSFVGNKAKGRISKRELQESIARQIFRKTNNLPLITPILRFTLLPYCWRIMWIYISSKWHISSQCSVLTPHAPTPQNDQIHSNNSSANCKLTILWGWHFKR